MRAGVRGADSGHRRGIRLSRAWGWLTGLIVGGGAYLALLALPVDSMNPALVQGGSFVLGALQSVRSRPTWWYAVPLGTGGSVVGFIVAAGPEVNEPVVSALRLLAYVILMNTPGIIAAVIGLVVRLGGERLLDRARLS